MPVSLNPPPGYYLDPTDVTWEIGAEVDYISFTNNGAQPAISEYIAYDTLVPPNPFIAVTQDGRGNVVYDGGFPKLYNSSAPINATSFADLPASYKFFYNALNFVANPDKVAAGNRKALVLGDRSSAPYWVKDTSAPSSFRLGLDKLFELTNFTPTYKDSSDYGTELNPSLAELEQYCLVFLISSNNNVVGLISNGAVQDLIAFRENGGGIVVCSDHGPELPNLEAAYPITVDPGASGCFFSTANKLVVNFGAYFSGNYNRSPVNVGFLRQNYGDHPLYAGMDGSESIYAGGSESRVVVAEFDKYLPGDAPPIHLENGRYVIQVLAMRHDRTIETYRFVYTIASGAIVKFTDEVGNEISELDVGVGNTINPIPCVIEGAGLGTLSGELRLDGVRIGELRYTEASGQEVIWYAGDDGLIPVKDGSEMVGAITAPFQFTTTVDIHRFQPKLKDVVLSRVISALRAYPGAPRPASTVVWGVGVVQTHMPHLNAKLAVSQAVNVKLIRDYMNDRLDLPTVEAYVYNNQAALNDALGRLTPPTTAQIFNQWDRFNGDDYFPQGQGATGDAAAWYWDDVRQVAVQPNNSSAYTGFISDEAPENYDLEVSLESNNADDDYITVVMAFVREGNLNHTLSLVVCRRTPGVDTSIPVPNIHVAVGLGKGTVSRPADHPEYKAFGILDNEPALPPAWAGRHIRVRIERRGDVFKVLCSDWDSDIINPNKEVTVDLNSDPLLTRYKGGKPYGYGTYSQAGATFMDINYRGGLLRNVVVDALNNRVYRYSAGSWALVPGVKAKDVYGAPRVLIAAEGGARYRLNVDGTITAL